MHREQRSALVAQDGWPSWRATLRFVEANRRMRILIAGWFSFEQMGASAGELLARDVLCRRLAEEHYAFDVAVASPFTDGIDWRQADPASYSHVVFVCGPCGNGPPLTELLARFADCRLIGVNLSMMQSLEEWNPFDLLLERDSSRRARPDLASLAQSRKVPIIGITLVHHQPEYGARSLDGETNEAIERLLASRDAGVVQIDTRLDTGAKPLWTPAENADDFGLSVGVNQGIIQAHELGIVTSASLMIRWPAAPEAALYGRQRSGLSLGLHVDLGEWSFREGRWMPLYEVIATDDADAVAEEVGLQLAAFRRLVRRNPTHMDSHQHVHLRESVRSVMIEHARMLGVPLRHISSAICYCGDFYGQTAEGMPLVNAISVETMFAILAGLPEGITELTCHPGQSDDQETMYRNERAQELSTLCDPRVRNAINSMGI
jgi:chitin disaccharide deacetylase